LRANRTAISGKAHRADEAAQQLVTGA